jgi:hypothetical protein
VIGLPCTLCGDDTVGPLCAHCGQRPDTAMMMCETCGGNGGAWDWRGLWHQCTAEDCQDGRVLAPHYFSRCLALRAPWAVEAERRWLAAVKGAVA